MFGEDAVTAGNGGNGTDAEEGGEDGEDEGRKKGKGYQIRRFAFFSMHLRTKNPLS